MTGWSQSFDIRDDQVVIKEKNMPKNTFLELDEAKKEKITEAALNEFAAYGYEISSTNRIVKECGISKGSLFQYFENKEDLYFYLIDTVAKEMAEDMKPDIGKLPKNIKERIIEYSLREISWYMENPVKGRFMIGMASERGDIYKKTIERYGEKSSGIYEELIKDAKFNGKAGTNEMSDALQWVLKGYNEKFLKENDPDKTPLRKLEKKYVTGLSTYLDIILQTGDS